jgi:probable DNA repair protein
LSADPADNPRDIPGSGLHLEALACLERGGTVIAANARAARSLRRVYTEAQRASGRLAWPTPPIHDWDGWLAILWNRHLYAASAAPLLLSAWQERAVWKRIVGPQGSHSEALARLAADAWKLLSDFRAHDLWSWRGTATADAEAFRGWAEAFDRDCVKRRWLSRSDLPALLAESIGRKTIGVPAEMLLVGFDRITPSQETLVESARSVGSAVAFVAAPRATGPLQLVQASEPGDELETCAWWARSVLAANPSARIAVIAQDIESSRGEIERTFRRILMPQSAGIETGEPMPFEFSLGIPLAAVSVVKAALLLLRWAVAPLEQAAISWLMISGFLAAGEEEQDEMAALDSEIREHGKMPSEVSLEVFAGYPPRYSSQAAGRWFHRLRQVRDSARALGANQRTDFAHWTGLAEDMLRKASWPGVRRLQTHEFQAFTRWERLLGEVAALGFDGGRVGYREFVTTIDRYANEIIFAPESSDAPVQIMGALESSGQHFDAVWFLGADEGHWPPPAQPHPLLPRPLQRKAEMPHASVEVDWQLALALTRRIAGSAAYCVFSYAQRGDAGELRPSALLSEAFGASLSTVSSEQFRKTLNAPEEPPHRCLTRWIDDDSSIPWPSEVVAGGASILKNQAACAFRAFATHRLGADEVNAAERGLTAHERGNIVHQVLQSLWSQAADGAVHLHTRDDLFNAFAAGTLPEILAGHIERVFKARAGNHEERGWRSGYLAVERERLQRVLLDWLAIEKERTDFTVEALEREFDTQVNGLKLSLRVDRIDQVEGGRFILDYKTGKVSAALWEGDRPDDPQLPLYATHGNVERLRGVLFAQVRPGKLEFTGRVEAATETLMSSLSRKSHLVGKPLDAETLEQWSVALHGLAASFLAGNAEVAPKAYPKTCRYCPLPTLCRVAETAIALEAEDEAEDRDKSEESSLEGDSDD